MFISCCRFAAVFLWDSGSSVGEVSGHSKLINSVDIRQKRPYRLVVGSDDTCGSFFEGPPFKFKFTLRVSCRDKHFTDRLRHFSETLNQPSLFLITIGHLKSVTPWWFMTVWPCLSAFILHNSLPP